MYSRTRLPYNIHYFSCQLGSKRIFNEHYAYAHQWNVSVCLVILFINKTCTLSSQIEGYTRLLVFRKFSNLPAVIWASLLIKFKKISSHFVCSPTKMKFFPSSLLLEPTCLLNLDKNYSLPFYESLPLY